MYISIILLVVLMTTNEITGLVWAKFHVRRSELSMVKKSTTSSAKCLAFLKKYKINDINAVLEMSSMFHELELHIKDKEIEKRDMEIEKVNQLKRMENEKRDMEIEKIKEISELRGDCNLLSEKLNFKAFELLTSKGTCTSRGVLEYYLKEIMVELGLKGTFNAMAVCSAIDKFDVNLPVPALVTRKFKKLEEQCKLGTNGLYELYGVISSEIHGGSWSGPAMNLYADKMGDSQACFIKELANSTCFTVNVIT